MYTPDQRITPYLDELSKPARWVNHTNLILHRLGVLHGHAIVDQLLNDHWKKVRHEKRLSNSNPLEI